MLEGAFFQLRRKVSSETKPMHYSSSVIYSWSFHNRLRHSLHHGLHMQHFQHHDTTSRTYPHDNPPPAISHKTSTSCPARASKSYTFPAIRYRIKPANTIRSFAMIRSSSSVSLPLAMSHPPCLSTNRCSPHAPIAQTSKLPTFRATTGG